MCIFREAGGGLIHIRLPFGKYLASGPLAPESLVGNRAEPHLDSALRALVGEWAGKKGALICCDRCFNAVMRSVY